MTNTRKRAKTYNADLLVGRDILDLLVNSERLAKVVKELRENGIDLSIFEEIALKHLSVQQFVNCEEKNKDSHYEFRREVDEALIKLGFPGLTNMGDDISPDTLLLIILHYATEKEAGVSLGRDGLSKMDFTQSACINFLKQMLSGSLVREYAEKELKMTREEAEKFWEKHKERILKAIAVVDHRFFISKDKDKFDSEVKALAKKAKTTIAVLDILGIINANYHNIGYHLRTDGKKKLSNMLASITIHDSALDRCDPQELSISNFRGHILHSEGWLAGYIKDIIAYPPELLNFFEQVIAGSFEDIFHEILDADPFWATEIARRFANGNLTPQEAEALRKLLLAIRIKGGNTARLMKKLMIAIMNFLVTRDEISPKEAVEMVPGTLQTLRDDYKSTSDGEYKLGDSTSRLGAAGALLLVLKHGCLDKDEAKNVKKAYPLSHLDMVAAHHELIEHQPKKLEEKLSKFIPKLLSMHRGSSKGGITKCLMNKLITAIMNFILASRGGIEAEEAIKLVQETIETLRENHMSDTEETPAAEALLLTLEYNYLGKAETDRIKESCPVTQLTMVAAHNELVEHQPKKLKEKLEEFVPSLLSLHESNPRSLIWTLSRIIFNSSFDLDENSSEADITTVLKKLHSYPDSNNEASVVFSKLIKRKSSLLNELPILSIKLLNRYKNCSRNRIELARIKTDEGAKLDDLRYLALSLEPHCDINNLDEEELTRDLFTDTKAQAVFDRVLKSYNENKPLLQTKLMNATPRTASDARNWSTFIAEGVRELESTGLVGIKNVKGKIFVRCTKGAFAGSKWKNCTIMFINGKRYDSYKNGMDLLKAAKKSNTITLTVLLSG